MKKLLLLCILFPQILIAQTADEIIQKYSAAMGGLDPVNKIQTAKISGTLISQGQKFPITISIVNGKSMRTDANVNGQVVSNVYDKGKGWKVNPFESITTPTEVTAPDDLALLKVQSSLANNLMDYKKRGHTVEFLGKETIESIITNKIKLTSKDDGKTTIFYIGADDNKLLRSDSKQKIQGNEYDAETWYSDFKTYQGLVFSTRFIRKIQAKVFQEVTYEKIELNVPIDDSIFKMPK
jgi:hypothetical protein